MKKIFQTICLTGIAALAFAPFTGNAAPKQKPPTIVGLALAANAATGEFSTLIAALQSAGLVDALNGKGQLTVFAPTDAAFAKLGLDATNISDVPVEALTDILLYHVAHGHRLAVSVVNARQIRMLNGDFARIGSGPSIEGAGFLATDLKASNGVVHVIDSVLLPPEDK